ncbi:MAG TPA: alpha/beta hydrolase [Gaiellaceae bacterium]|nr:alpha/beta hydrolase [Gaiellaceae bacterium]
MAFLLLHGLEGSGPEHWQTWIAGRLEARGLAVAYPDLPDADAPRLADWLTALEAELAALPLAETTVLCHSLGCLLWLHHDGPPVARALLVAPTQPDVESAPAVGFRPIPRPVSAAASTRFVCSTDDPWCPPPRSQALADQLGAPVDWLVDAGHVNADTGFGPWPELEAWCVGERESLTR